MPCCGQARRQLAPARSQSQAESQRAGADRAKLQFEIAFEYTGRTGLTVIGSVSGRRYRFEKTGSRVVVDPRDRPGLSMIPKLRQVT
jgi:hypothetical protein